VRGAALIVLAWNQWPLTKRCLDSLLETDLDGADIIVVDNGSIDETPAGIADYAERVRYVRLTENLGFVRGMNAGIAAASADDDVVLLNNDLKFTQRDWLNRLRDAAYAEPEFGIVGCRLLGPDDDPRVYHAGGFIEADELSGHQTESGVVERDIAQFTDLRRVQGIAFALAYIRRDCLDRIGALDTTFHSYFEDTDYCLRAADAGIATVVAGGVTLQHDQHGSTQDDGGFRQRLWAASRASFAARWHERLRENYRGTVLWQGATRYPHAYAQLARTLLRRLDARGLRMAYAPVASELANPEDHRLDLAGRRRWSKTPDAGLICAPPHQFAKAQGRYRVGLGFGEWDQVPARWAEAANSLDLLLVPDVFQAEAFRAAGVRTRIEPVPIGVDRDYCNPRVPAPRNARAHFVFVALAEDLARDAPDLIVSTFLRTFRVDEPAELLLYVRPGMGDEAIAESIALARSANGERIRVIANWTFPDYQRAQLLAAGDAYVSARRGGGWDPLAGEALACAKPLIACAFGSQRDMVSEFGFPVAVRRLVEDPAHPGCRWAEPDADSLAARMREVFENRNALRVGAPALAAAFAKRHDLDTTADRLVEHLASAHTLAPPRVQPRPHSPAALPRPASGQIVVLGMHRSGTSSVAGLLARMGVWPGSEQELLIGPDNPKGHYELAALHGACIARLAAAGGDWSHPPGDAPAEAIDAFRREFGAIVDSFDKRRPWLVKEPRLCLLVREILPSLTRPVFVHVVRDPLEVADSLAARDGLDRAHALSLWERYARQAFAGSRGWPRLLVGYAELLADPLRASQRLLTELSRLGVKGLVMPDAQLIRAWIDPNLRLQRSDEQTHGALTTSQRALYTAIGDRSILDAAHILDADSAAPEAASLRARG
jgi:GT2 family glycosyltransferase